MTKNISLHIKRKTYITTNKSFVVDKQSTYNVILFLSKETVSLDWTEGDICQVFAWCINQQNFDGS